MLVLVGSIVRKVLDVFFLAITVLGMAYSMYLSLIR